MKRILTILGGGIVAVALSLSAVAHEGHQHAKDSEKSVTLTGELLDSACYVASGGDAKGAEHTPCARECLASGIPAAVLPEGSTKAADLMFLLTNPVVLAQYAGQTVKVEGTAHGDMRAIDVKKLSVRDGDGWKEVQLKDAHRGTGDQQHGADHGQHHGQHHEQPQGDHQHGQQKQRPAQDGGHRH